MEQMRGQTMPHIVHSYSSCADASKMLESRDLQISCSTPSQNFIYHQHTVTSQLLNIPITTHQMSLPHELQVQIIQSTQHPQENQQTLHILQPVVPKLTEVTQSTLMLPPNMPIYKQPVIVEPVNVSTHQYYEEYNGSLTASLSSQNGLKTEPELNISVDSSGTNAEIPKDSLTPDIQMTVRPKKPRGPVPDPNKWVCNVRKLKHQRGEAYVSRRGKLVPEKRIKTLKDCMTSCKFECNKNIGDADRQLIFKSFYSLNAYEKKYFLLNSTERFEKEKNFRRKNIFRYFFVVRGKRYAVCKHFYLGTLSISQKPVYNVHKSKSETNIPKPDGRGLSKTSCHELPDDVKNRVRKHIISFRTIDSKSIKQFSRKKQYLEPSLTVKKMYRMYYEQCLSEKLEFVKESMYRKIFKTEFNLVFKKRSKEQLCTRCKELVTNPT